MIFTTWSFAVFGAIVWAIYWAFVPQRGKPIYLIVAGAIFYAFSVPAYLALIATLALVTYSCGRGMLAAGSSAATKDRVLALGVAAIVGVLVAFKYAHFLLTIVNEVAAHDVVPLPQIVVPLAISFFTFEFVHVLVDIRLGKIAALPLLDFLTFAFFFPTLVAGPIKRFQSFAPQIHRIVPPTQAEFLHNVYRIAIGIFKKLVLADSASVLTAPIVHPGSPFHRLDYWVACLAYAAKIYFDFSGYSDIAIGVAGCLGFRIPENFERPYWSRNVAEFWRRWHITLSSWIRDYVFVPLGGSRRPPALVALNLLLAMTLVGLWHGAAWTFVVWGLWHGAGLSLQRAWSRGVARSSPFLRAGGPAVTCASVAMTFTFVALGWIVFAAASLGDAMTVYRHMFLA